MSSVHKTPKAIEKKPAPPAKTAADPGAVPPAQATDAQCAPAPAQSAPADKKSPASAQKSAGPAKKIPVQQAYNFIETDYGLVPVNQKSLPAFQELQAVGIQIPLFPLEVTPLDMAFILRQEGQNVDYCYFYFLERWFNSFNVSAFFAKQVLELDNGVRILGGQGTEPTYLRVGLPLDYLPQLILKARDHDLKWQVVTNKADQPVALKIGPCPKVDPTAYKVWRENHVSQLARAQQQLHPAYAQEALSMAIFHYTLTIQSALNHFNNKFQADFYRSQVMPILLSCVSLAYDCYQHRQDGKYVLPRLDELDLLLVRVLFLLRMGYETKMYSQDYLSQMMMAEATTQQQLAIWRGRYAKR